MTIILPKNKVCPFKKVCYFNKGFLLENCFGCKKDRNIDFKCDLFNLIRQDRFYNVQYN